MINTYNDERDVSMNSYYNLTSWENHSIGVMLIAGFSGSGKTTLGRELAKYYNCPVYEFDGVSKEIMGKKARILYIKLNPGIYKKE